MARKNSNARRRDKPRRTRIKLKCPKPKIVVLSVRRELDDGMSPGKLRAVAEWREKENEYN